MDELPIVTQADRDAAASFFEGPCTEGLLATLFAHHRIASIAELTRAMESDEAVIAALAAHTHPISDNSHRIPSMRAALIAALAKATQ